MDICKHKTDCGGCTYQGISYEEELREKEALVLDLIEKKKLKIDKIDPIEPCPTLYGYRNKMEYTFGDMVKNGPTTLGMHKKGHFMSIVTVDECQLVHEDFNNILRAVLEFSKEKKYKKYHKKTHKGLLRNLIVRRGQRTGELLINIVTSSQEDFDEKGFVSMIESLPLKNKAVGILHTINDQKSDTVVNNQLKILKGRDFYIEEIMGLKFKVSAFSFFQTNISAVERLYKDALSLAPDFENMTVFDLFCGTGTITQALALKAKEVYGVEIVKEAVETARITAEENGFTNCHFIEGDVFKVLENLSKTPDLIVVDPPRKGIEPKALDKIISYGVDNIIYISCNPKTLAENLYYLNYNGYDVKYLKPYDNFGRTDHVETVCLMSRNRD